MAVDLREFARFWGLEGKRSQLGSDDQAEHDRLRRSYEIRGSDARRFERFECQLAGRLVHGQDSDGVTVLNIGPGGALVEGAFFLGPGDRVDLHLSDGGDKVHLMAKIIWVDKRQAGLQFTGVPSNLEPYWRVA